MEIKKNSIIIRNVDFESEEFKKFNRKFSVWDQITHKYTSPVYSVLNSDVYIPASVGILSVKTCFPDEEETDTSKFFIKSESINITMKLNPRDQLQENSISFLMKMKKDGEPRLLSLKPGSGKTYVAINVISKLNKKAIIIVDTLSLAEQWKEQFLKHSNINPKDIIILSGRESIDKELKSDSKGKIYIAIHRTLGNVIEKDPLELNDIFNKLKIGIQVFDECHENFKNICDINCFSNIHYSIYLSATPGRSKRTDNALYDKVFGRIKYYDGYALLKNSNYCTVVLAKYNSNPTLSDKISVKTKYGFNLSRWASAIMRDYYESFIDFMIKLIKQFKLIERQNKFAIMLPTIEMLKQVYEDLKNEFPDTSMGLFIGEVKKEERAEALQQQVIITNHKIFDKAIDVPDLEVLLNFVPLASNIKTEQIMGRLRYAPGKTTILIDIADYGFPECIQQQKIRKRFYKKKAKKIVELN